MSALLDLAARCEAATGPDRELDAAIQLARGYTLRLPRGPSRYAHVRRWHDEAGKSVSWLEHSSEFPPAYTASIDAAMSLVPEGWGVRMGTSGQSAWAQCKRSRPLVDCQTGDSQTLSLALCAAALRARAAA